MCETSCNSFCYRAFSSVRAYLLLVMRVIPSIGIKEHEGSFEHVNVQSN
jgi:hypothetical protein